MHTHRSRDTDACEAQRPQFAKSVGQKQWNSSANCSTCVQNSRRLCSDSVQETSQQLRWKRKLKVYCHTMIRNWEMVRRNWVTWPRLYTNTVRNAGTHRSRGSCCHGICLFVCLLAELRKNYATDFHKIRCKGSTWVRKETFIRFWW